MKKRYLFLPVLLLLIVVLAVAVFAADSIGIPQASEDILEYPYTFHTGGLKNDKNIRSYFPYSDKMLLGDANTLNGDVAKASMALAFAAYHRDNVNSALGAIGYTAYDNAPAYQRIDELTIWDNDAVAYTIAYHDCIYQGENYRIYCVPVKGTSGNAEWFSNFHLGDGNMHEGFQIAAETVYQDLTYRMAGDGLDPDHRVIWLTGHSRGAAVANIVAGWLVKRYDALSSRVFGYTFACPSVSTTADTSLHNIFNFNAPGDLIPLLPCQGEGWGFKRNGVTIDKWSGDLDGKWTEEADAPFYANVARQFQRHADGEAFDQRERSTWNSLLHSFVPDRASFYSRQNVLAVVAYMLGGNTQANLGDLILYCGYNKLDRFADDLNRLTDIKGGIQAVQNQLSTAQQKLELANQMLGDMDGMTAEQEEEYLSKHSSEVQELSNYSGVQIIGSSAISDVVNMINTTIRVGGDLLDILQSGDDLFFDADGNILTAVKHGHSQVDYASWINSLFCGYQGWYQYSDAFQITDAYAKSVGSECFYECSNLLNVKLTRMNYIGDRAFYNCSSIESADLGDVATLQDYAFYGCTGLREVTVPVDLYTGAYRFFNCESVETIHYTKGKTGVMPDHVDNSYSGAYYRSYLQGRASASLRQVDFAEGITHIGDYAFYTGGSNTVLQSVQLPNSLESIGSYAFYGQAGITDIQIPAGVKEFGAYSFYNCAGLKDVSFNAEVTTIPYACFYGCTGLTELVIPDTVESLADRAFYGCTGFREVTIPVDMYTGSYQFYDCSNIEAIHYTRGKTGVMSDRGDNSYSGPYYQRYLEYQARSSLGHVDFAEGITRIGDYAFYTGGSNSVLQSVQLPSTLESIGRYAFYEHSGITDFQIPASVKQFGAYSFYNCSGLKEVSFNTAVTTIPYACFYGCTSLTELIIPDTMVSLEDYAFYNCTGLREITIPVDMFTGRYQFSNCSSVEAIYYTKGKTGVMSDRGDNNSYYQNYLEWHARASLSRVDFAEGITHIGNYAFYNNSALRSAILPATLESVGNNAFYGCSRLDDVYYADSQAQFAALSIADGNVPLKNADLHDYATLLAQITRQPEDVSGYVGETAAFSVKATGEGLTYRWQYKDPDTTWTNSSFKTASMSCKITAARDGRQYQIGRAHV
jgi:hypothetical protein